MYMLVKVSSQIQIVELFNNLIQIKQLVQIWKNWWIHLHQYVSAILSDKMVNHLVQLNQEDNLADKLQEILVELGKLQQILLTQLMDHKIIKLG